jgi:hypothetical protein
MAHPRVANGGDIWRVAAGILNKESRTADRGWPSSLWVGRIVNKSLSQNVMLRKFYMSLGVERFFGTTQATSGRHEGCYFITLGVCTGQIYDVFGYGVTKCAIWHTGGYMAC